MKRNGRSRRFAGKWLWAALLLAAASGCRAFDWDPFYERSRTNGVDFTAIRPFFSSWKEGERWRKDYLWPLYTRKGFKKERYARLLFFGFGWRRDEAEDAPRRNWLLPVWFQGVGKDGKPYTALFPLGGTIRDFLGLDEAWFVLFPLVGGTRKGETTSRFFLWPVWVHGDGPRIERRRFWPFYGRTTLEGEYVKKFVLWPFYTSVRYTNPRNPGGGFILLPFYGRVKTLKGDTRWWIPPFFRYLDSEELRIIHAPWPFIQWADGTMYKRIFWPIYGKKELGTQTRISVLWPVFWHNITRYARFERHRRYALPFFYYQADVITSTAATNGAPGDVPFRYWKLWPLMSWERNGKATRFRLLDLWPLRNTPGIEHNWAPLWTLYRRTDSGDGEVRHDLLWGLYRRRRGEDRLEWSLLKGAAGYKRIGDRRSWHFLFFRFGDRE